MWFIGRESQGSFQVLFFGSTDVSEVVYVSPVFLFISLVFFWFFLFLSLICLFWVRVSGSGYGDGMTKKRKKVGRIKGNFSGNSSSHWMDGGAQRQQQSMRIWIWRVGLRIKGRIWWGACDLILILFVSFIFSGFLLPPHLLPLFVWSWEGHLVLVWAWDGVMILVLRAHSFESWLGITIV